MSLALAFVRGPGGRVDAYAQQPFALRTDRNAARILESDLDAVQAGISSCVNLRTTILH